MFAVPEHIKDVIKKLSDSGFEAFLVGGCVRDFLMRTVPHDYDIATNALPQNIKEVFSQYKLICTGEKHGTILVITESASAEITSYRIDGNYSDHRHPEKVIFSSSIYEDLKRRDFTINSIAYSVDSIIADPFHGADDIKRKIIKATGDPDKRFSEDALRILRALRFSSCLGFEIEEKTSNAIFRNKELITDISCERIRDEFVKLMSGKNAVPVLRKYRSVIAMFIPEIIPCFEFAQNSPYHKYDVWEHTLHAVDASADDIVIKLAMFFHDIAKPECYTEDSFGTGHFKGHAAKSGEKTEIIMKRLKFPTKETKLISLLIYHHSDEINSIYDIKKLLGRLGKRSFFRLLNVQRADAMSKQSFCAVFLKKLDWIEKTADKIIADNQCCSLSQLDINGSDLKSLGLSGVKIGETLSELLDLVMHDKLENKRNILIDYAISTIK